MWSEILKLRPQLDTGSFSTMLKNLSSRFSDVAKKFGAGLAKSLAFGGGIGIGMALADKVLEKLLNPLKEAHEVIEKILKKSDDIVTNARQFGTSSGKFAKLQALGRATGVEPETLRILLGKFQNTLAEARANEKNNNMTDAQRNENPLRKFIGEKDTADAFYKFAVSMQKAPENDRILIQQQLFGEKLMGRAYEFFSPTTDYQKIFKKMGAQSSKLYDTGIDKLGELNDLTETLAAGRELNDFGVKSGKINSGMVYDIAKKKQLEIDSENRSLTIYDTLKSADLAVKEFNAKFEAKLTEIIVNMFDLHTETIDSIKENTQSSNGIRDTLTKFLQAPMFRGVFGTKK